MVAAVRFIYPDFLYTKGIDLEEDVFYAPFFTESGSTIQFLTRQERRYKGDSFRPICQDLMGKVKKKTAVDATGKGNEHRAKVTEYILKFIKVFLQRCFSAATECQ